ncbi:MAG: hypothetical protein ACXVK3_18490 [Candidatus Angelobacter sp.]
MNNTFRVKSLLVLCCVSASFVHANEHMGQLVAYARMTGVVPPWSQ